MVNGGFTVRNRAFRGNYLLEASIFSRKSLPVLKNAKVYATTADAVADLNFVVAATARRRDLEIPVVGTNNIGAKLRAYTQEGQSCGVMFGPEKAGLTNDDVVLADEILTYPINPAFQSLNLSQAVGVFSYMWAASAEVDLPPVFQGEGTQPANREDLVRMFEHFEGELEKSGYFYPPAKKPLMQRNIRAPFMRAKMTEQEVRTMRGMIKALSEGRGKARE